jgi:flagellar protein FliL
MPRLNSKAETSIMDNKNAGEEQAAEKGGQPANPLLIAILAAAVIVPVVSGLMTVGMVGGKLTAAGIVPKEPEVKAENGEKAAKPVPPLFYPPLEFLVNLADTGETHYLRATVSLAVPPTAEGEEAKPAGGHGEGHGAKADPPAIAALKSQEPVIRDLIIGVISSRTLKDLSTPTGKEELKENLRQRLQQALALENVAIYFTAFTLQ